MITSASLRLYFGNATAPGLYRTVFSAPGYQEPIIAVRGPLFNHPNLPFIWSCSCVALSLLFVSALIEERLNRASLGLPLLQGDSTSPAGTLGRLMNKGTRSWLHDIFGSERSGRPLLARILLLGNPRGRRHGPTTASLRTSFLAPKNISVFVDGEDISSELDKLENLRALLLADFAMRKNNRLRDTLHKHPTPARFSRAANG